MYSTSENNIHPDIALEIPTEAPIVQWMKPVHSPISKSFSWITYPNKFQGRVPVTCSRTKALHNLELSRITFLVKAQTPSQVGNCFAQTLICSIVPFNTASWPPRSIISSSQPQTMLSSKLTLWNLSKLLAEFHFIHSLVSDIPYNRPAGVDLIKNSCIKTVV